jgi:hypothetical protein
VQSDKYTQNQDIKFGKTYILSLDKGSVQLFLHMWLWILGLGCVKCSGFSSVSAELVVTIFKGNDFWSSKMATAKFFPRLSQKLMVGIVFQPYPHKDYNYLT